MKYYIGIDMGTSSLKLTIVDESGNITIQLSEEYDYAMPNPDWREINPSVWIQALNTVMKKLGAIAPAEMKSIICIGITGQMHTTCFLDMAGKNIRPAIMWNDTRAVKLLINLKEKIKKQQKAAHIADIISSGSPALNIYWLKKCEPENFARLDKFLIGPDYMVYYLTGYKGTDYCEASTSSLYDLYNGNWSEEIRIIIGLRKEQYPTINGSSAIVGLVHKTLADKWHISRDVKVIAGTGDNAAAAVATGVYEYGFASMSLGTSGVLVFTRDKLDFSLKGKNIAFSVDGKKLDFLVQGVLQSCGRTMNWWLKNIVGENDFSNAFNSISLKKSAQKQLLFYPHIMGDKTLYGDTNLRGAFLGLSENDTKDDMLAAIMEGIAFATRELIEKMAVPKKRLQSLRFTGGGSKNKLWLQIMASVLNMPVQAMPDMGGASYGAALLAMEKLPKHSNDAAAEIIYPEKKLSEWYRQKYNKYLKIYEAIENVF
ncbi:xylulokinase [Pectinatus haikarae]|uniref:Xylulokinase n=1 Tax=Pectinatus haikarae TaxID=349096 RepID=A0ABT9YC40_9FIRM|nr:FGGY family carbohydrate kinase [Pectinatus haikarae]MDQ0205096.1 xylulokinase [Pectinatus haikarae]